MPRRTPSTRTLGRWGIAALILVGLATLGAPVAFAGPPPSGTVGPLLQLTPTSGRASAGFTANYWYVDGTGAKCIFTTADISWDGATVVSPKMDPPPRNSAYCSLTYAFAAPPTTAVGKHTVSILACYIDGNGKRQCPAASLARVTYIVQPTPTLKVSPGSGRRQGRLHGDVFDRRDRLQLHDGAVLLGWQGDRRKAPDRPEDVPLDPQGALGADAERERIAPAERGGVRGARCLPATQAIRSFTVTVPKPTATPKATATPTPSPTPVARPSRSVPPSVEPSALPSAQHVTRAHPGIETDRRAHRQADRDARALRGDRHRAPPRRRHRPAGAARTCPRWRPTSTARTPAGSTRRWSPRTCS